MDKNLTEFNVEGVEVKSVELISLVILVDVRTTKEDFQKTIKRFLDNLIVKCPTDEEIPEIPEIEDITRPTDEEIPEIEDFTGKNTPIPSPHTNITRSISYTYLIYIPCV